MGNILHHNMTSRGWVYTIHDPTEDQIRAGQVWLETSECIGIFAGLEQCSKTGRPHIQGYVRLDGAYRKGKFRKIIGPNASGKQDWYMAKALGDWAANAKYTSKDENVIWHKVPPASHQGTRTDLENFRAAIKRNCPDDELIQDHLPVLAKYPRLESRLKLHYLKQSTRPFREVEVIVHYGAAGSGKTRKPYEEGAYVFDDYENGWWDGYDGESVVLFNDFYGGIKWSFFLRLLDGYQVRLKVKGGFTYAQWSKVYITSNKHPDEWYRDHSLNDAEFRRRITNVIHFDNLN